MITAAADRLGNAHVHGYHPGFMFGRRHDLWRVRPAVCRVVVPRSTRQLGANTRMPLVAENCA